MLELIERLLLEADLDSEISKLDVYGKTIDGLKDFLKHLLLDPNTGKTGASQSVLIFLPDRQSSEETGGFPVRLRGDRAHHSAGAHTPGHPQGRQAQAAALGAREEEEDPRVEESRGAQPGILSDLLLLQSPAGTSGGAAHWHLVRVTGDCHCHCHVIIYYLFLYIYFYLSFLEYIR